MDQDQEKSHMCKLCNKSFFSGKMLGGHMRSHGRIGSVKKNGMLEKSNKGFEGYGLREKPKKSRRLSCLGHNDGVSEQESVNCGVCGKEFGALKSLYGHMRLHSGQEKKGIHCKQCGKLFASQKALSNHMRLHSEKFRDSSRSDLCGMSISESDIEIVPLVRRKRSRRIRYKLTPDSSFSSLNESVPGFEIEQDMEDVAMCLIMMSKGIFGELNSLHHSERNEGSEGGDISDGDEAVTVKTKKSRTAKVNSCASDPKLVEEPSESYNKGIIDSKILELEYESGGRFKCRICNKTFLTHQSLGGHQTSHRTTGSGVGLEIDHFPKDEQIEFSPEIEATDKLIELNCIQDVMKHQMGGTSVKGNGSKEYKCAICFKIFSSGQALGGHKRAHPAKACEEEAIAIRKAIPGNSEGFSINLPYKIDAGETDQDDESNSCWAGSSSKQEQLVGLIGH